MNRFKLWFNKNGFKVISIIVIVLAIYYSIKGFNNFFRDMKEDRESEIKTANTDNQNNISTDLLTNQGDIDNNEETSENNTTNLDNLPKIEHLTEEYNEVIQVAQKILNCIYKVTKDKTDTNLKQELYNMYTQEAITKFSKLGKNVEPANISEFVTPIENLTYYSAGTMYKCAEKDDTTRYALEIKLDNGGDIIINSYMIININHKAKIFSYSGDIMNIEYINQLDEITEIKNKGTNNF